MDIVDSLSSQVVEQETGAASRSSLTETLTRKWASAALVTSLSLALAATASLDAWLFVTVLIVASAGAFLAAGWPRLVKVSMPLPSQVFIGLSALTAAVAVAFVRDQSAIVFVVGVSLAFLVGLEIWTAPSPRDHSAMTGLEGLPDDDACLSQRVSWVSSSATSSLATAVSGMVIAVGGTAWVAMAGSDSWRLLVPVAAVIVACVVIGNQIGSSWLGQALWALTTGVISGALGASVMLFLGHGKTLGHLILPALASLLGPQLTVIALGVGTGVVLAIVVMVIDAVMGDHDGDSNILVSLSRGAAKFLLCGLLVYTVIRVAGA